MKATLLLSISFLFSSILLVAQPGKLDVSFGNGGIITTDNNSNEDFIINSAMQSDGKIIVLGRTNITVASVKNTYGILVRYNSNGIIDSSFGENGKKLLPLLNGANFSPTDLKLTSDESIIVCGNSGYKLTMHRCKNNGIIDSAFGKGGLSFLEYNTPTVFKVSSMTLLSNNKILLNYNLGISSDSIGVMKINANGTLDTTFGKNGFASTTVSVISVTNDIALQKDGKIVITAISAPRNFGLLAPAFGLARFTSEGLLDSSFGINGKVVTQINGWTGASHYLEIQQDNKILLSGYVMDSLFIKPSYFAIARYLSNGKLDSTFGSNGIKICEEVPYAYYIGNGHAVMRDGRIVMAGYKSNTSHNDFAIIRLKDNGIIDSSFGSNGLITTDINNNSNDITSSILLLPDQRILVSGSSGTENDTKWDFVLAQYLNSDILPITLSSFTVSKKQTTVLLNWQTTSEIINNYFAVERSNSSNTGFKEIGKVFSKGNSLQTQSYNYEDVKPLNGLNYYRLQQVDKDGKSSFSKIIAVDFKTNGTLKIYANPVKDILKIEGLTGIKTTLSVVDINGKILSATTTSDFVYNLNVQTLPAGNYFLKVETSKTVNTLKFVKE